MKRFFLSITSSAIGVLLLSSIAMAAAFSDVSVSHKNYTAIDFLAKQSIIGGYPDGTFKPGRHINRAELMKILVETVAGTPNEVDYKDCFPDVHPGWFEPYVCYAKAQGWVGGYPDGSFRAAQTVADVESLKMILNANNIVVADPKEAPFKDVALGQWFTGFVYTAKEMNLLEETGVYYEPGKAMSRAAVAEIMYRLIVMKESESSRFGAEVEVSGITGGTGSTPPPSEPPPSQDPPAQPTPVTRTANVAQSAFTFEGYEGGQKQHDGGFNTLSLTITNANDPVNGSVEVSIDINSMFTDSSALTGVLKGGGFFDAASHPNATFSSTSIISKGNNVYGIVGNLTLKGVTQSITFDATITDTQFTMRYDLDRTAFGVGSQGDGVDPVVPMALNAFLQ